MKIITILLISLLAGASTFAATNISETVDSESIRTIRADAPKSVSTQYQKEIQAVKDAALTKAIQKVREKCSERYADSATDFTSSEAKLGLTGDYVHFSVTATGICSSGQE